MPSLTLARCALVSLFLASLVTAAGTVSPSNATLSVQAGDLEVFYSVNTGTPPLPSGSAVVFPLTANVGLGQSQNALSQVNLQSSWLRFADAFSYTSISINEIAYISCDPNSNTSNIDPSTVVASVASQRPRGILLYSLTQSHCAITGDFGYTSLFTMTSAQDARAVSAFITANLQAMPTATIVAAGSPAASSATSTATAAPQSGPTTAVAMSILYSITGVITVLFLVIIASGAVRAHRHPERYGPRAGGASGRPRQSRAKGLARAMLETLPIVKFGDDEPAKPGTVESIELGDGPHAAPEMTGVGEDKDNKADPANKQKSAVTSTEPVQEAGIGAATAVSVHSREQEAAEVLGCSICTEDFEKGEDVRVLPCNHKYHPACVDPWLLNVSGTCPLCRIDLRPTTPEGSAEDAELAPPLEEGGAPDANAEGQNMTVLRTVPASERLAALRALRDERRQQQRDVLAQRGIPDPDAVVEGEEADRRRRHRLTLKLKEKFGVKTRRRDSAAVGTAENGESSLGAQQEGEEGASSSAGTAQPRQGSIVFGGSTGQDSLAMRMR